MPQVSHARASRLVETLFSDLPKARMAFLGFQVFGKQDVFAGYLANFRSFDSDMAKF